jgi:8-oxo-dGTP diphosphatase
MYVDFLRKHLGHALLALPAVNAVVVDAVGRVLLQKRRDDGNWTLPGGIVEPGESVLVAVARETLEETGIDVTPIRLTGLYSDPRDIHTYPNGDQLHPVVATFLCHMKTDVMHERDGEAADVAFFDRDQLPEMPARYRERIRDAVERADVHVT